MLSVGTILFWVTSIIWLLLILGVRPVLLYIKAELHLMKHMDPHFVGDYMLKVVSRAIRFVNILIWFIFVFAIVCFVGIDMGYFPVNISTMWLD